MSSSQGIQFLRNENEEFKWFEHGDEDMDGKYVGEIEYGEPNGQGTYTLSDGYKYEGEWKDGKYRGQGTLTLPDGRKYVGEWKEGKKHGQGTETLSSGWKYVGDWKEGKPWNITIYGKSGIIIMKYVNGVEQK